MTEKYSHHSRHPIADSLISHDDHGASPGNASPNRWRLAYWIAGIGSLIWLLLRSGTTPRRLAYPCQRVAAANSLGFLAYLAALLSSATFLRRLKKTFSLGRWALFLFGLLLTVILQSSVTAPAVPILAESPDLPGWTSPTAVSDVFVITNVPEPAYSLDGGTVPGGVEPDEALRDGGVDALVNLMETSGDYFYQTASHPDGIFATDDVIVIKVNNQWDGRNGTNTDVVKGVIYRLVSHQDGFTGAVIIAENTQRHNDDWYHQPSGDNSQFQDQSYQEVAQAFASEGHHVCISDWKSIRENFVDDYDAGNDQNGYVLMDADGSPEEQGHERLSYPKFQINCNGMNLRISMQNGVWDDVSSSWDTDRHLKMINVPVPKRHGAAGATIALKNYIGFITTAGSGRWVSPGYIHCWLLSTPNADGGTCTTYTQEYGLIARQMARIRRADLNIVDAIWVNPRDNVGYYERARRQDVLLASRDPFAVDYYASDYILGPLIQTYEGSLDHTQSMASTHGGLFRIFLMRNVERLRAEGVTDTINIDDGLTHQQELDQFNVYVADANEPTPPVTSTLTLQVPNGGEVWMVGTRQQIRWASTGEVENVRLEYSTDGFTTPRSVIDSTENDGVYTWTVPTDPSTNALVRVSSTLSDTISDTSNAVFTIVGPHAFEDSFKTVSHRNLEGGETITYIVVLYEESSATLTFTDTVPWPLTYVPGSADIEPGWKGTLLISDGIYWSGTVTGTQPVTITFQAQAPVTTTTLAVTNHALVSRNGADPVELRATSFINGFCVYLPVVLRDH